MLNDTIIACIYRRHLNKLNDALEQTREAIAAKSSSCIITLGHTSHVFSRIKCCRSAGKFPIVLSVLTGYNAFWFDLFSRSAKMARWLDRCQTDISLSTQYCHVARKMWKSFKKWWKIFWLTLFVPIFSNKCLFQMKKLSKYMRTTNNNILRISKWPQLTS